MAEVYDVIVVGGGGSGLAAAASAAQHGAGVLLLEKQPELGGTTGIAIGSFTASGTSLQRKAGIQDNPQDHAEDAGKFARPEIEARNNRPLREFFLSQATPTLQWLSDLGLAFCGPNPEPPNRVPRMHNVVPNAKAYIAVLQSQLLRRGGTILTASPVEELLLQNGRVRGVRARVGGQSREYEARRGVVLAAGDYANCPPMIARHKGQQFAVVEGISAHASGDGHRLAEQAGAGLLNMDIAYGPELRFVPSTSRSLNQLLPSRGIAARIMGRLLPLVPKFVIHAMIKRLLVSWQHPEDSILQSGAILVNARGRRFCNELLWPQRELAVAGQPDKTCYILLDERLITRYSQWPHFVSTAPEIAYAYVDDYLRLRPDVAVQSRQLEELAQRRGLPADELRRTVDEFNRYSSGQAADPLGRTGDDQPLRGHRWVLLGPAKAYFITTEGGAAINQQMEVLDEDSRPIPGLYAVGQNGLGGQVLWGHGLHIAWALTSGRLAGEALGRQPHDAGKT